jgi:ribosomal protein S18 acetylase RimI-like enzyme
MRPGATAPDVVAPVAGVDAGRMALRRAGDHDIPAVVALMNLAFRAVGASAGWNSEASYIDGDRTTEPLLRQELRDHPDAQLLVVEGADGRLAGSVMLEPLAGGVWQLGSLAIDPALQNEGAGRRLLAGAERWAAAAGARSIRMKVVNVRDTLIAWYVRRGYVATGVTEPFPYGDDRFGTPRRLDLSFTVLGKTL